MKWSNLVNKLTGKESAGDEQWRFATNIMCNGCIAKITPVLDAAPGVASWSVDLKDPDRILTIVPNGITREDLIALVQGAGFTISPR